MKTKVLVFLFLLSVVCAYAQDKKSQIILEGVVYDSCYPKPVPLKGATVTLVNKMSSKRKSVKSDSIGHYSFGLSLDSDFIVFAAKKCFINSMFNFSTKSFVGTTCFRKDLYITRYTDCDGNSPIRGIMFGFDSSDIRKSSYEILDTLVNTMKGYPYVILEIGSHTDCHENNKIALSTQRSENVVNYFVSHGIERERLVSKGYGDSQLLNNCACGNGKGPGMNCTEAEHQINRRTTFKVLSFDYKSQKPNESNH